MTISAILFYLLAALILVSTTLAVTRRRPVHAVLYLIVALLGLALIFQLLGAPLLAALQVIIYAGAIMVLFIFVIIAMPEHPPAVHTFRHRWLAPLVLCLVAALGLLPLIVTDPVSFYPLASARLQSRTFGFHLFRDYWYAVELFSLLLFVGLAGALYLGRSSRQANSRSVEESR